MKRKKEYISFHFMEKIVKEERKQLFHENSFNSVVVINGTSKSIFKI